ncbi:hypothetical protein AURDEDRAFT_131989, partial [Auricularia subglabra TFB-10046 SS5]
MATVGQQTGHEMPTTRTGRAIRPRAPMDYHDLTTRSTQDELRDRRLRRTSQNDTTVPPQALRANEAEGLPELTVFASGTPSQARQQPDADDVDEDIIMDEHERLLVQESSHVDGATMRREAVQDDDVAPEDEDEDEQSAEARQYAQHAEVHDEASEQAADGQAHGQRQVYEDIGNHDDPLLRQHDSQDAMAVDQPDYVMDVDDAGTRGQLDLSSPDSDRAENATRNQPSHAAEPPQETLRLLVYSIVTAEETVWREFVLISLSHPVGRRRVDVLQVLNGAIETRDMLDGLEDVPVRVSFVARPTLAHLSKDQVDNDDFTPLSDGSQT